jgi:hypothetical protein
MGILDPSWRHFREITDALGEPALVADLGCRVGVALKFNAVQSAGPIAHSISICILFAITSTISNGIEVSAWLGRIGGIIACSEVVAEVLRIPHSI